MISFFHQTTKKTISTPPILQIMHTLNQQYQMEPSTINTQASQDFMNSQPQQQPQYQQTQQTQPHSQPQPQTQLSQPQQPKFQENDNNAEITYHQNTGGCYNPYDTYFNAQPNYQTLNPPTNPNYYQHSNQVYTEWYVNHNPPQPTTQQLQQGSSMYPVLPPLPPKKPMHLTTNSTQFQSLPEQQQQPSTQGFITTSTTITSQQHELLASIHVPQPNWEQNNRLRQLEEDAKKWLYQRLKVIEMLQSLVNDMNRVATKTTKTKIGGTATNIVGAGLLVGGIVAAPFTFGGSLLASTAGLGLVGAGTAVTVGSSIVEWKHAKKMAELIQVELEKDTQEMNEMLRKIYEYRSYDTYMEYRILNFDNSKVTVMQFVNALVGNGNSSRQVGCIGSGKLTHGNAGATSLASLLIKGAIPIVSIPVDVCLLVQESKRLNGKEPSKLASRVTPVIEALRMQTQLATGQIN